VGISQIDSLAALIYKRAVPNAQTGKSIYLEIYVIAGCLWRQCATTKVDVTV